MYDHLNHHDITKKIFGCAMWVHRKLGNGLQEGIYQRSLEIEIALKGLIFVRETEMNIHYGGMDVCTKRVDFFVENLMMAEMKALTPLEDLHLARGINDLAAYNVQTGLLINLATNHSCLNVCKIKPSNPNKTPSLISLKKINKIQ